MKILSICPSCKKRKLYINYRTFNVKNVGIIKSQNELCGKCTESIKDKIKDVII